MRDLSVACGLSFALPVFGGGCGGGRWSLEDCLRLTAGLLKYWGLIARSRIRSVILLLLISSAVASFMENFASMLFNFVKIGRLSTTTINTVILLLCCCCAIIESLAILLLFYEY